MAKFRDNEYVKNPKEKNSETQIDENQSTTTRTSSILPSYCTMEESKIICSNLARDGNTKKRKLLEVHKLLFKQEPKGQLHNALVDISVTLRIFLKLTKNIDICKIMTKIDNVINVENNNDICNLINPLSIDDTEIEPINYTGELITGLTILSDDNVKEEKIMVESIYRSLATTVVNNAKEKAVKPSLVVLFLFAPRDSKS